jgi:hypothetical protein
MREENGRACRGGIDERNDGKVDGRKGRVMHDRPRKRERERERERGEKSIENLEE